MDSTWGKSSYSYSEGNCLEARWQTSSYSGSNGDCLEARQAGVVQVRDSKDREGPVLSFTPAVWTSFTARLR